MSPRRNLDLPLLPTPLIGRDREIAEVRRLIVEAGARLVTLTGPPGVGKTSLALSVAHDLADRFRHGVRLVELAPIGDPALVAGTIAEGLGIRRSDDRSPLEQAIRFVRDRRLLLVLDNFEQIAAAASDVAGLLANSLRLVVLVTSRVPLRIRQERELAVEPLALPDLEAASGRDEISRVPAVALFVERAAAVSRQFRLTDIDARRVGEICAALDGLPLAIELAAARVRTVPIAEIHASLVGPYAPSSEGPPRAAPLELLKGGARDLPARQRTLRDAIAWSYDLLTPEEQRVLRRLAVFVGGCTFEAAERVSEASWETIATLARHGLLRYEQPAAWSEPARTPEPRVRLLETVRQFGIEQLEAHGEWGRVCQRHAAYFLDLEEQAETELAGAQQTTWLARLAEDLDNLRAAARRATASGDAETMLRLASSLFGFWRLRGDAADARERVDAVLALAAIVPPIPATVKAFAGAGDLARVIGEYATAESFYLRSLDAATALGDRRGAALARGALCQFSAGRGEYGPARQHADACLSLFEALEDRIGQANALRELGMLCYFEGDNAQARDLLERAWVLANDVQNQRAMTDAAFSLAMTYHVSGELEAARLFYQQAYDLNQQLGFRAGLGSVLNHLGSVATLQGDYRAARTYLRQSIAASREAGDRRRQAFTLSVVAGLAAALDAPERALMLDAAGIAALEALGARLGPPMRALYDGVLQPAWAALDQPRAAAARAAGRAMPLDQAVDEALAWLAQDAGRQPPAADEPGTPADTTAPVSASAPAAPSRDDGSPSPAALTRRERSVAVQLGRGHTSNRDLAAVLGVSEGTAASYVQRVMTRLELRTRAQAAAWAVQHQLDER